jgi:hypothetical protein
MLKNLRHSSGGCAADKELATPEDSAGVASGNGFPSQNGRVACQNDGPVRTISNTDNTIHARKLLGAGRDFKYSILWFIQLSTFLSFKYPYPMILSSLCGHIMFWTGAVGLAISSTAGVFVSWLAVVGISLPPGKLIENSPCVINFDWTAVVPFFAMAALSLGTMRLGKSISVRCRGLVKGASISDPVTLDSPDSSESSGQCVNGA